MGKQAAGRGPRSWAPNGLVSALLAGAAAWDLIGVSPRWWTAPTVSYGATAAALATGCALLLVQRLRRRSTAGAARGALLQLAALGLALGAWLLRGHPEVPVDPPLVAATALAAALHAWGVARGR